MLLPQRVALIVTKKTRPRQTGHGLSEGRGVAQFPLSRQAGLYAHVSHESFVRVDGAFLSFGIPLVPTNRVDFNTFGSCGHDCSNHPVFTARLSLQHSRWRRCTGHFAAKMHRFRLLSATRIKNAFASLFCFRFLFAQAPLLRNCSEHRRMAKATT